ncbi:MAG: hypothetical protein K9N23_19570, partial [Akkermansiaceae bacterium]|nr:hypothetical protein [Akkermansiaceae bacterium]
RNTETPKHRNTETPKHRNTETPKHRNTETPKHRNTETPGRRLFIRVYPGHPQPAFSATPGVQDKSAAFSITA